MGFLHLRPIARDNLVILSVVIAFLLGSTTKAQSVRYFLVSRQIVEARLEKYGGKNAERESTLKDLFAEAGCNGDHLTEQKVSGSRLPNVICTLPGSTDRTIIVGAHFDHVSEGDGVVDNWSGASLLPSIYQAVSSQPRTHTYIFIGFTDEEQGEVGSRFYVEHMKKQEVASTDAMVNMDTLGLAPTEIWTRHTDRILNGALATIARQLNLPVTGMNVDQIGSTDSVQFEERKIPSITIHSLTQKTWDEHILHTKKDTISEINRDDYYQTYQLVAAYVAYLDSLPPRSDKKK